MKDDVAVGKSFGLFDYFYLRGNWLEVFTTFVIRFSVNRVVSLGCTLKENERSNLGKNFLLKCVGKECL